MRQRLFIGLAVLTLSSLAVGCATRTFVREEVARSDAKWSQEVGRLDTALAEDRTETGRLAVKVTETRSVADEATRRSIEALGLADEASGRANEAIDRAGQAETQAGDALTKAEQSAEIAGEAVARADRTDQRMAHLWNSRHLLQPGETVVVSFAFDQWTLDDRAETRLLDVVSQLLQHPQRIVRVEGYTDNVGSGPYNLELSQRRAEAVRRFLVAKGIELHRIHSIGLGDLRPAADNKTRQGRDQNRRVAVTLLAPVE